MGSFLNNIQSQVNSSKETSNNTVNNRYEGEEIKKFAFGEKPYEELSEKGRKQYEQKSYEETKAFLLEKGFLNEGTQHLDSFLQAVKEGKPIACIQAGTTGLLKPFPTTAYDNEGNPMGKRSPFLEHNITNVGIVIFEPNADGIYKVKESYSAVIDKINPDAIKEAEKAHFETQCQMYNKDNRTKPISEYKAYHAIKDGGFGIPVKDGGFGFEIDDRFNQEICKSAKEIEDKINSYKDVYWISNLNGLKDVWLKRSGINMEGNPESFLDIMREFQLNSKFDVFKDNNGNKIKEFSLDKLKAYFNMEDEPRYKAVDRARSFGEILFDKVIAKINEVTLIRKTELEKEFKEKMAELESEMPVPETSALEDVGVLGDLGMSVGVKENTPKEETKEITKVTGSRFNVSLSFKEDLTPKDEKLVILSMLEMADVVASAYSKKLGTEITLANTSFTLKEENKDNNINFSIVFVGIPEDKEADFERYLDKAKLDVGFEKTYLKVAEKEIKVNSFNNTNSYETVENPVFVEDINEEKSNIIAKINDIQRNLTLKNIASVEIEKPVVKEEPVTVETKVESVKEEPVKEKAEPKTEPIIETTGKEMQVIPKTTVLGKESKMEIAIPNNSEVTKAISTLVSAIQEPILAKLQEQEAKIASLTSSLESARRLLEENNKAISTVLSKQIELETKQVGKENKTIEKGKG